MVGLKISTCEPQTSKLAACCGCNLIVETVKLSVLNCGPNMLIENDEENDDSFCTKRWKIPDCQINLKKKKKPALKTAYKNGKKIGWINTFRDNILQCKSKAHKTNIYELVEKWSTSGGLTFGLNGFRSGTGTGAGADGQDDQRVFKILQYLDLH